MKDVHLACVPPNNSNIIIATKTLASYKI